MRQYKPIVLFFCLIVCSLALAMSSCKSDPLSKLGEKLNDNEMEQLVKVLNEQCPVSYEIGTATSFSCQGKKVVINYTIDEEVLSFEKMNKNDILDAWRMMYADCCSSNDKAFLKSIVLSGYQLNCVFTGSSTGHKAVLDLSNEQLKNNKPLTQEEYIKTNVAITRAVLPMPLNSVTNMVDVVLEKENLIYVYDIDDENFDISKLENESSFREIIAYGITQQFVGNSSAGELFKKLCLSGRGLCYRYIGSKTHKTIDITFSNTELMQMANDNDVN